MKKIFLFFALIVGLLTSASTMQAQTVNMSRYITLTVAKDSAIMLDFKAAAAGTPVRIVSGSNTQDITVGTNWYGSASYTADGTTMKVYGDITDFSCKYNGANLTALDPSHNTQLTELYCYNNNLSSLDVSGCTQLEILKCYNNNLSSLDVSKNTQLTWLYCNKNNLSHLDISKNTQLTGLWCFSNTLSSLDVSKNTKLTELRCSENRLSSLDVSKNTKLTKLWCSENRLSSLDLSKNTQLTELYCYRNQLSSLDISKNTQLGWLYCYGNNFSTAALDDIYCALPDRTGKWYGVIEPLHNSSDPNHATVLATNAQNAIDKNWKVLYDDGGAYIHTTGSYDCSTAVAEASAEQALTLYPNPVADVLYLSATARTIRVYNIYGTEVAHATDTDRVEVSHLPAGIYTVRADGTVAKMVKR